MRKNIAKQITIRKGGHLFEFRVLENGKAEYRIDNGQACAVKQLKEGRVEFVKKQEVAIDGMLVEIDGFDLCKEDFEALQTAQDEIVRKKQNKPVDDNRDERLTALLKHINSWEYKVKTFKDKNKQRHEYCSHYFRIGNDEYSFSERFYPEKGVIVNPEYKVDDEVPGEGGIPKQYGELMFWCYYYTDGGWKRIRKLTNNEFICLNIIQKYGYFSVSRENAGKKIRLKLFSKKIKVK